MKTGINKSDVMKRAWKIFRSGHSLYSSSFSEALSRAWQVEKTNAKDRAEKARLQDIANSMSNYVAPTNYNYNQVMAQSLTSYYANNRYNGD